MKLELVLHNGNVCGYNIVAESHEEEASMLILNNFYTAGVGMTSLVYAGAVEGDKVKEINFMLKGMEEFRMDLEKMRLSGDITVQEVKEKPTYLYRCPLPDCLSTDVQRKAWVRPNDGNQIVNYTDSQDYQDECYCNRCGHNVELDVINISEQND